MNLGKKIKNYTVDKQYKVAQLQKEFERIFAAQMYFFPNPQRLFFLSTVRQFLHTAV